VKTNNRYRETQRVYEFGDVDSFSWLLPVGLFGTTKLTWHKPGSTGPENATVAAVPATVTPGVEQSPVPHAITVSFGFAGVKPAVAGPTKL
jgi:hypothetical protein